MEKGGPGSRQPHPVTWASRQRAVRPETRPQRLQSQICMYLYETTVEPCARSIALKDPCLCHESWTSSTIRKSRSLSRSIDQLCAEDRTGKWYVITTLLEQHRVRHQRAERESLAAFCGLFRTLDVSKAYEECIMQGTLSVAWTGQPPYLRGTLLAFPWEIRGWLANLKRVLPQLLARCCHLATPLSLSLPASCTACHEDGGLSTLSSMHMQLQTKPKPVTLKGESI